MAKNIGDPFEATQTIKDHLSNNLVFKQVAAKLPISLCITLC